MYDSGTGVPQDNTEAAWLFRLAADQGYAHAQSNLGVMYANGTGVPQDFTEAARLFRLAADQGYAGAQCNLGVMYGSGSGVAQDSAEAARLLTHACDQGFLPEKILSPRSPPCRSPSAPGSKSEASLPLPSSTARSGPSSSRRRR